MTRLYFSNTANPTALSSSVVASDTALPFSVALTGWPVSTPYKAVIEPDTSAAEVVLVTGAGPSSFTVVRGQDGTTAQNHSAGSIIEHRWSAAEADEANAHVNSSGGVHGLVGNVVGTTDVQTVTNKTLTSPLVDTATMRASSTTPALVAKAAATGTANLQEWQDNAGVALSRVGRHGDLTVGVDDPATKAFIVKGGTGQTANLVEVQDSTTAQLLAITKAGRFVHKPNDTSAAAWKYVPPTTALATYLSLRDATDTADKFLLTTEGEITRAAKLWLAGINADDPLRYPLDGSKFKVDQNGNIVTVGGATVASVTSSGAVTANNLPAVAAAKAGKRIHWSTAAVTTDASGNATVTHGAGFTPTVVHVTARLSGGLGGVIGVFNIGATTFDFRVDVTGALSLTVMYVCFE